MSRYTEKVSSVYFEADKARRWISRNEQAVSYRTSDRRQLRLNSQTNCGSVVEQ